MVIVLTLLRSHDGGIDKENDHLMRDTITSPWGWEGRQWFFFIVLLPPYQFFPLTPPCKPTFMDDFSPFPPHHSSGVGVWGWVFPVYPSTPPSWYNGKISLLPKIPLRANVKNSFPHCIPPLSPPSPHEGGMGMPMWKNLPTLVIQYWVILYPSPTLISI